MSFQDLPPDWPTRPLSDAPLARDVVDLFVSEKDRADGAIAVLLCGRTGRLQHPMIISGADAALELGARCPVIRAAIDACRPPDPAMSGPAGKSSPGSVLFVLARTDGGPTDVDRAWHQQAIDACRAAGVTLLGVHIATLRGVETLPQPVRRRGRGPRAA